VNLLKSPLRRTTAVLAGAVIGLAGVVATAAPAMATHPTVKGTADCVTDEGWTAEWTVTNKWPNDGEVTEVEILSPRKDTTLTGDIAVGAEVKQGQDFKLVGKQSLPADARQARIKVTVKFDNGHEQSDTGRVARPEEKCEPETPPTEPEEPETPAAPTPIVDADCTTLTIGLDNPEDGEDITLVMKTSKGETRELEVPAGQKETTKFSATEGFSVEVSAKGVEGSSTVEYEQPEDCAGTGGGSGELPLTGAAAGSIAGGAGLLLAVGGVLFFLARRRKVKFTA
jgi:LPXTG-motif cell wall-anchored protein